jgi:hypothetical protein
MTRTEIEKRFEEHTRGPWRWNAALLSTLEETK